MSPMNVTERVAPQTPDTPLSQGKTPSAESLPLTLGAAYRAGQSRSTGVPLSHTVELETHVVLAPDLRHRVIALTHLALWCAQADYVRGRHVIANTLRQANELGDPTLLAKAQYAAVVGRVIARGEPGQAAEQYKELMQLSTQFRQLNNPVDAAWCDLFAGVALEQRGDPSGAIVLVDAALAIFRRYGDLAGQARCFNTFGMQQSLSSRHTEAIRLYRRAHDLALSTHNPATHAVSWLNVAEAHADAALEANHKGDRVEAHRLWEQTRMECEPLRTHLAALGHRRLTPRIAGIHALTLVHLGHDDQARAEAQHALALAASLGEPYPLGTARLHAAYVHIALREFAEAHALLTAVLAECAAWMRPIDIVRAYRGLMDTSESLGDLAAALAFSKGLLRAELIQHDHAIKRRRYMAKVRLEPEEIEDMPARSLEELLRLNEELEAEREKWEQLARTDSVTGLANRGHFDEHMTRMVARTSASKRPLSLLIVDIDFFKKINDTFGHPAGDEVLRRVATTLRRVCRRSDMAARVGGEEFALLLPGVSIQGAIALAERLRVAVRECDVSDVCSGATVTVSVGVATFHASSTPRAVYAAADEALYLAKETGRDRVCVATA